MATVNRVKLFDARSRTDHATIRPDEDTFAFLDRVDDVYFGRVRDLVETWFATVPSDEQASLRGRLRSRSEANSAPAFWELYLRELLRQSGYSLTHEPKREHRRRPDFLASGDDGGFYLEARFVGPPEERQTRAALVTQIRHQLNKIENPDYLLHFGIRRWGSKLPRLRGLRRDVEEWLAGLDYDEVVVAARARRSRNDETFVADDWAFSFAPIPKQEHARGRKPRAGIIAIGPAGHGGWSESTRLTEALEQKAGYYGDLDEPFILALCCGDVLVDDDDISEALYREPDPAARSSQAVGLFRGRGHPRVSAVMTLREFRPWLVHRAVPVLWKNPNAAYPLTVELPWISTGRVDDGGAIVDAATVGMAVALGLSEEWPGPEQALRVRASVVVESGG
jgi:hypothetical protein